MRTVLCGLQSPINIGMALRSVEAFDGQVFIVDTFEALNEASAVSTVSDFSCGAWQRLAPKVLSNYDFLATLDGRIVCASSDKQSVPLPRHRWQHSDILLIGNEYTGVPPLLRADADISVKIPMTEKYAPKPPSHHPIDEERAKLIANASFPVLNVAVATSILLSDAYARCSSETLV